MNRISFPAALVLILAVVAQIGMAAAQTLGPYAGEQTRTIKALSAKEIDDLAQGRGMGLAKAVELNRFPGPLHGLELAEPLKLSGEQRETLKAIMARMSAEAKALGAELLGLERELDVSFAARAIDEPRLRALTEQIGARQGALKAVHLTAHIETAAVLSSEQIARYDELRGYSGNRITPMPEPAHGGHGAPKN